MKDTIRKWLTNGWVVGTGTAILATLLLRPIDKVLGTNLAVTISGALGHLGYSFAIPVWLVAALMISLVALTVAHLRNRAESHRKRTLRIVSRNTANRWSPGKSDGKPAMQLSGRLIATNVADKDISVIRAHIVRPRIEGMVMVRHPQRDIFGWYPIPAHKMSEVAVDFWIVPAIKEEGRSVSLDIELVDQFGTSHRVKSVVFHCPPRRKLPPEPPKEAIHALDHLVEKQVASVLKAELSRYAGCGRSVGGMGSVECTYQGRTTHGVGADWRVADSPKNQSIALDPENASISSDNALALVSCYGTLESQEERDRFVTALLNRLSRTGEYADVGYLILLVLFRIGKLDETLRTAKETLRDDSAISFSNFVWLLDGLLKFEHPLFSAADLDEAEKFMDGLSGETFRVIERVNAVRAYRLARPSDPSKAPAT